MVLVDARGIPLSLIVIGANRHDVSQLGATLDAVVVPRPPVTPRAQQHCALAATATVREVCGVDRTALGRHHRLLSSSEQGGTRICRGLEQQDPRHPATMLWTARRRLSPSEDSDLHASSPPIILKSCKIAHSNCRRAQYIAMLFGALMAGLLPCTSTVTRYTKRPWEAMSLQETVRPLTISMRRPICSARFRKDSRTFMHKLWGLGTFVMGATTPSGAPPMSVAAARPMRRRAMAP